MDKKILAKIGVLALIYISLFGIFSITDNNSVPANFSPSIDILSPNEGDHIEIGVMNVRATIIDFDNDPITAYFIISNSTYSSAEQELLLLDGDIFTGSFEWVGHVVGTYILTVFANDGLELKSDSLYIQYRDVLTIEVDTEEITYNYVGVNVDSYVTAETTIYHDTQIRNLDAEIILPEEFQDATNYAISRGFTTYTPIVQSGNEYVTRWSFNEFQPQDDLTFDIATPEITRANENFIRDEEGVDTFIGVFEIYSAHTFYDVHVQYIPTLFLMGDYEFELFIRYGTDWIELTEYTIENYNTYSRIIEFDMEFFGKGEQYQYRLIGHEIVSESAVSTDAIIYGVMVAILAFIVVSLFTFRDKDAEPSQLQLKLKKFYWLVVIGIAIGLGVIVFLIFQFI